MSAQSATSTADERREFIRSKIATAWAELPAKYPPLPDAQRRTDRERVEFVPDAHSDETNAAEAALNAAMADYTDGAATLEGVRAAWQSFVNAHLVYWRGGVWRWHSEKEYKQAIHDPMPESIKPKSAPSNFGGTRSDGRLGV